MEHTTASVFAENYLCKSLERKNPVHGRHLPHRLELRLSRQGLVQMGPTGICGRGTLWFFGPNRAYDNVITRTKLNAYGMLRGGWRSGALSLAPRIEPGALQGVPCIGGTRWSTKCC